MHSLINQEMLAAIRETGNTDRNLPDRKEVLEQHNLPYDQPAENVIVTGCQILGGLPHMPAKLAGLFDRAGLSYTFLSKEYCCGNNLYRPAIKAKDEEAMAECMNLSREFVGKNMETARELGAKRLIIFCSPCYPIYKHAFPEADIIFYPEALKEIMPEIEMDGEIDYYPGCYRLHRKFAPVPMDLKSTNEVLAKIKGLKINRIGAPKCCYHPEGLSHMIDSVKSDVMLHVCTGCYFQALLNMPQDRQVRIMMLPELVETALDSMSE